MERSSRPHTSRKPQRKATTGLTVAARFIERCSELTHLQDLHQTFERSIEQLGFHYFACCSHVDPLNPGAAVMLLNYPAAWVRTYSELKLHCMDPVLEQASSEGIPFSWDDPQFLWSLSRKQRIMLDEARAFGIAHGYTIPLCSPSSPIPIYASCSVIPDGRTQAPDSLLALRMMADCMFSIAVNLLNPDGIPSPYPLRAEEEGANPPAVTRARDLVTAKNGPSRISGSLHELKIERILRSVLTILKVERAELFSRSQRHNVVLARAAIAWHVTERKLAHLIEVATWFRRSAPALSISIGRYRAQHPKLFRLDALHVLQGLHHGVPEHQCSRELAAKIKT